MYAGCITFIFTNIIREGIRVQSEKLESASGEVPLAHLDGNPYTRGLSLPVNFLFSAVASFRTFRIIFRPEPIDTIPGDS
jgi:hypothetical protein